MPGRKPLRRLQLGLESTNGTAVAATARMRWNGGTITDLTQLTFPDEDIGQFDGADRSFIEMSDAELSLADTPITPEQLPYPLAAMLGSNVTGVADGTGSTGFRYTATLPTTTVPTNRSYTLEGGDDFEVEQANYLKFIELTLKGSAGKVCTMSGKAICRSVARLPGGFAATTLVTVNDLIFGNSQLFLDAIGAIGTTQITNQFLGFEVTIKAMWEKKFTGDGNGPVWQYVVFVDKEVTGKITFEHDPAVSGNGGEKANMRAQTPRALRINLLGQNYATAGSGTLFTGGRRGVQINLPIKWTQNGPLEDQNKNDIITMPFRSRPNATFGGAGSIIVCNEVSALP